MASLSISQLPVIGSISDDTIFPIVITPGSNPQNRAITGAALRLWLGIAPSSLSAASLSNLSIPENSVAGTPIGALTFTSGATISLLSNDGGRVALNGNNIVIGATNPDYETHPTLSFAIRQVKAGSPNSPLDTVITVTLIDVPVPSFSVLPTFTGSATIGAVLTGVDGTVAAGTGTFTARKWQRKVGAAAPVDIAGATGLTYTLVSADSGNTVRFVNTATNVEGVALVGSAYSAAVGSGNASTPTAINVAWIGPYAGGIIPEGTAVNTVIANLTTTDADSGDTFTYTKTSGDARFSVVGSTIIVASSLDYDGGSTTTPSIVIRTTDAAAHFFERTVNMVIGNIFEVTLAALTVTPVSGLSGNQPAGTVLANITGRVAGDDLALTGALLTAGAVLNSGKTAVVAGAGGLAGGSYNGVITHTHPDSATSPTTNFTVATGFAVVTPNPAIISLTA